jgi:hypothetical protein
MALKLLPLSVVSVLAAVAALRSGVASAQAPPVASAPSGPAEEPPPPGPAEEPQPPDAAASPQPVAAPAPASLEVTVEGEKAPPGSATLGRRDIRELPGALGDPYRAIEVQPGVTPTASAMPYYFIRGAPPGNVGYFFDGIQVPLLFHVGAGPSVVPAAVVGHVELHLGPYPADIGRLAGAAVEAESSPPAYAWRGEGSFRFGDIGGVVEGPVSGDLTVLVGGHYAIGAALLSALVPSVDMTYADYQARASLRLGPASRLTLFAFGAYDYLASTLPDGEEGGADVLLDSDFHRLDLRYERESDGGGKAQAALTFGLDQLRQIGVERARDYKVDARVSVARPVAVPGLEERALVRAGLDAALDGYDVTPRAPRCNDGCEEGSFDVTQSELDASFAALFPSRVDLALGAWADARVALAPRSTLTPALRVDYYTSLGRAALAVDPKLVGRFGVGERLRLVPAVGVASQLPGFAPLPALQIGRIEGGLQRSLQTSFGAELGLGAMELTATAFRQATFNLTDPIGTGRGTSFGESRFLTRSLGDAYGLELSARGALRRDLFFLASYTLSRSTRERDGVVLPSAYDRTHVAHVALLYDLGGGWRGGVRHVFYTGFPADEAAAGQAPREHPDRVRPFYRFDVRLAKRWKLGQRGYAGLVFDLQNATLSKEVFDVSCDADGCSPRTIGPIAIPGIAIEAGF